MAAALIWRYELAPATYALAERLNYEGKTEMVKIPRKAYMLEFKHEAVCPVESGQRISEAAWSLGVVEQTLSNWVRAPRTGKLRGSGNRSELTAEQMEIPASPGGTGASAMKRDILGKATAFFCEGPEVRFAFT